MKKNEKFLEPVVQALCQHLNSRTLPSRETVISIVDELKSVLFPGYFGLASTPTAPNPESLRFHVGSSLDQISTKLEHQIERGFKWSDALPEKTNPQEITQSFIARLPEVQRLLLSDVKAAFEGDPAATSPDEAIFCYPGITAMTYQRIAHELFQLKVPLIPRIITEYAHSLTGIDIHPGASIGEEFFIDHGTGVVIGETCIIGNRVRLYQGVTLGAKSFPLDQSGNPIKGIARHPILEDEVIVYAGATILGRITIGRASVIGGNMWITEAVAAGSRIYQAVTRS